MDTVDILGHALITFESILAEVSNLHHYELLLCDEIDSTHKHRTIVDRSRTCQTEAKSGIQLLTSRCKAQLNNIHNHFSMQVSEIKTRFEKAFEPLDLLIERWVIRHLQYCWNEFTDTSAMQLRQCQVLSKTFDNAYKTMSLLTGNSSTISRTQATSIWANGSRNLQFITLTIRCSVTRC